MADLIQQGAAIQRFRNTGTIQRVKIVYIQKDVDEVEHPISRKSFRKAMEDLESGLFERWTKISSDKDPEQRTADITGGGGRGDYRLHATKLEGGGFRVDLFQHSGDGRRGGGHVPVNTGATYLEKDSALLAEEVHPTVATAPPTITTPPPTVATPPPAGTPSTSRGASTEYDLDFLAPGMGAADDKEREERRKALGKKGGKKK
jgi:hypothetical protein